MRFSALALAIFTTVFAIHESAEWTSKVEDDIFSGGKKAILVGQIDSFRALVFNCDSDSVEFAYVGQSKKGDAAAAAYGATIIVKVDQSEIERFNATSSQRNDTHWQVVSTEKEQILKLLNQIRDAHNSIQVGVQVPDVNFKVSGVASTAGSTRETDRFTTACKL